MTLKLIVGTVISPYPSGNVTTFEHCKSIASVASALVPTPLATAGYHETAHQAKPASGR